MRTSEHIEWENGIMIYGVLCIAVMPFYSSLMSQGHAHERICTHTLTLTPLLLLLLLYL